MHKRLIFIFLLFFKSLAECCRTSHSITRNTGNANDINSNSAEIRNKSSKILPSLFLFHEGYKCPNSKLLGKSRLVSRCDVVKVNLEALESDQFKIQFEYHKNEFDVFKKLSQQGGGLLMENDALNKTSAKSTTTLTYKSQDGFRSTLVQKGDEIFGGITRNDVNISYLIQPCGFAVKPNFDNCHLWILKIKKKKKKKGQ